jgi:hypothetical protein
MKKSILIRLLASIALALLIAISASAQQEAAKSEIVKYGEVKPLGNGVVWSWIKYGKSGTPTAVGVTFTETALQGLPAKPISARLYYYTYDLALPSPGAKPYNHIGLDWNPMGHIPPGIYDKPHFDFHFYFISPKERDRITVKGKDLMRAYKRPDARYLPPDYILPRGTEVPRMGVHWVDPTAPEFNKRPFTSTFIYGSYNGKIAFIEPMVTRAFLETRPDISLPVKQPREYQKKGYYPARYSVRYDPVRKEYTVSLEGLSLK